MNVTPVSARKAPQNVWFVRAEMDAILAHYGRMVAAGTAKDYAIGMLPDRAIFAIYRRASEAPSWRVEKVPALARKQGAYVVYGMAGQVLRRGQDLKQALKVLESSKLKLVK